MKSVKLFGIVFLLAAAVAVAGSPNFSGSWVLDKSKSEIPESPGGGRFAGAPASALEIALSGDVLTVTRTVEFQGESRQISTKYSIAGGEVENQTGPGPAFKVKSNWEGKTLVSTYSITRETPNGTFTVDTNERLSLSEDGQALTLESVRKSQRGEMKSKLVYRKK